MLQRVRLGFKYLFIIFVFICSIFVFQNFMNLPLIESTSPLKILDYNQIQKITGLGAPYANIDSPLSTYISGDGNRYWLTPFNYNQGIYFSTTSTKAGTGFFSISDILSNKQHQVDGFSNWAEFPGRWWIVSTYQISASPVELIAFIHIECLNTACDGVDSRQSGIGVAYYKEGYNNGKFRYMGQVLSPKGHPDHFNIQGTPYLTAAGYMYVYFSDRDTNGYAHVAVARTNLSQLIQNARNGSLSPEWFKFNGGVWNSPGMGGDFTGLDSAQGGIPGWHIVHSGAVYSRYTKKYYITTYVNANQIAAFPNFTTGNGVFLFESTDLTSWKFVTTLFWGGSPNYRNGSFAPGFEYVTVTPTSLRSWSDGTTGKTFYVYSAFDPGGIDLGGMSLFRTLVTLNSEDCLGGPAQCGSIK